MARTDLRHPGNTDVMDAWLAARVWIHADDRTAALFAHWVLPGHGARVHADAGELHERLVTPVDRMHRTP